MIDNPTKLNLSLTLFSADSDRPNIMKFIFKENADTTIYHSKLNATYSKWVRYIWCNFIYNERSFQPNTSLLNKIPFSLKSFLLLWSMSIQLNLKLISKSHSANQFQDLYKEASLDYGFMRYFWREMLTHMSDG